MRRIVAAFALSTLFAAAPAFAHKNHVAKNGSAKTSPVVAGDAKDTKAADAKPADGTAAPAEKPAKKVKKSSKKVEKTETAPAEGAPAK